MIQLVIFSVCDGAVTVPCLEAAWRPDLPLNVSAWQCQECSDSGPNLFRHIRQAAGQRPGSQSLES